MRPLPWLAATLALLTTAGCPDDGPIEPTYENVAAIVDRSCAFSMSCHGGTGRGEARLNFALARDDITEVLNGVPACEYDLMPRVDPGNPDNSWILRKIEGTYTEDLHVIFEPDPSWVPDPRDPICPIEIEPPYDFGMRMPDTGPQLPANERTAIREWIRMGALGPGEVPVDAGPPIDAHAPADAAPTDARPPPSDAEPPPSDAEPPPGDAEPPPADAGAADGG